MFFTLFFSLLLFLILLCKIWNIDVKLYLRYMKTLIKSPRYIVGDFMFLYWFVRCCQCRRHPQTVVHAITLEQLFWFFHFWQEWWTSPAEFLIRFWLISAMTLTNFQGQLWNLLYLSQKWSHCHKAKSKHIDWTLRLKWDHQVLPWPWTWPWIFKVKYGICSISAKNGPIATKQKANISIEL